MFTEKICNILLNGHSDCQIDLTLLVMQLKQVKQSATNNFDSFSVEVFYALIGGPNNTPVVKLSFSNRSHFSLLVLRIGKQCVCYQGLC